MSRISNAQGGANLSLAMQYNDAPVLIHGPQACGKSNNAFQLAKSFGKVFILEHDAAVRPEQYPADAIVFANIELPGSMSFDQAMQLAGLPIPQSAAPQAA